MALRVLLADESSTIKKVFQLSLQDFAAEIKSVNIGTDVLEVAGDFKPDIIFADVLLQQKSGYEVSSDLKTDGPLGDTPVVLMWSSFMDIDEDKFLASKADDRLEKPFDVDQLRGLVSRLVPKTQENVLSQYLEFPELPDFDEVKKQGTKKQKAAAPTTAEVPPQVPPTKTPLEGLKDSEGVPSKGQDWNMESFDKLEVPQAANEESAGEEEFQAVNLSEKASPRKASKEEVPKEILSEAPDDSEWVQNDVESFRLNIEVDDNQTASDVDVPVETLVPESALLDPHPTTNSDELEMAGDVEDLEVEDTQPEKSKLPELSEEKIAEIVRKECRDIIETVVWRVVPEIATQVIEREIKRLIEENPDTFGRS